MDRLEADGVRVVAPDGVDLSAVDDVLVEVLAELERVAHAPKDRLHPQNGKIHNKDKEVKILLKDGMFHNFIAKVLNNNIS